jgi:hypothetical protein
MFCVFVIIVSFLGLIWRCLMFSKSGSLESRLDWLVTRALWLFHGCYFSRCCCRLVKCLLRFSSVVLSFFRSTLLRFSNALLLCCSKWLGLFGRLMCRASSQWIVVDGCFYVDSQIHLLYLKLSDSSVLVPSCCSQSLMYCSFLQFGFAWVRWIVSVVGVGMVWFWRKTELNQTIFKIHNNWTELNCLSLKPNRIVNVVQFYSFKPNHYKFFT